MNITVKIKPIVIKARTQSEVIRKISQNHVMTFGGGESYLSKLLLKYNKPKMKRVYNLVKVRPKFEPIINPSRKRKKIREGYWVAYVYDMPHYVSVKQDTRNFTIIGTHLN